MIKYIFYILLIACNILPFINLQTGEYTTSILNANTTNNTDSRNYTIRTSSNKTNDSATIRANSPGASGYASGNVTATGDGTAYSTAKISTSNGITIGVSFTFIILIVVLLF
jgi:hypothetical protein